MYNINYQKAIHFSKEMEWNGMQTVVGLVLLVRKDGNGTHCRIKCPANPLPVKGEFLAPGLEPVLRFLSRDGWQVEHSVMLDLYR